MASTLVIKIGTSSLTKPQTGDLNLSAIARLVEVIVQLRRQGYQVLLVSSGAVGVGCTRLGMAERPQKLALKQAVAAVGQGRLIRIYDDFFAALHQPVAQILLTRANLIDRQNYRNVYATLQTLLELQVVPIINENDTVAVEELKFGDNDTLSALVASLTEASWLFLLTDIDRLYSADPRQHPEAEPIIQVDYDQIDTLAIATSSPTAWGTGGMTTKLSAAKIASRAGVRTAITRGDQPELILRILAGESIGTQFAAQPQALNARKRWIIDHSLIMGKLILDPGAVHALKSGGRSLLPAGIVAVEGKFDPEDTVSLVDQNQQEFGRGISNFSSEEIKAIMGNHSQNISHKLGSDRQTTVVHRDNLVLLAASQEPKP
ncbi:MAG: glutamate 5-kinase [Pseudanabaenaceae cyanobacterium bins.68]|nr:glutamate 5-kinase [Pseudanabaenaceae cyanobacterium bins.68]